MRILFVHQNFPAQYRHLAATLAQTPGCQVVALGDLDNVKHRPKIPGVNLVGYPTPAPATARTHHYVRPLEGAVRRGQAVVRACLELQKHGFVPDVIYAHPGWGEALFLRDVFPKARLTLYCEFYYHAQGADVGFDPEFPSSLDDALRVRIKNAASLLSLEAAAAGISPTQWQRRMFPKEFRSRIEVIRNAATHLSDFFGARLSHLSFRAVMVPSGSDGCGLCSGRLAHRSSDGSHHRPQEWIARGFLQSGGGRGARG